MQFNLLLQFMFIKYTGKVVTLTGIKSMMMVSRILLIEESAIIIIFNIKCFLYCCTVTIIIINC